MSIIHSMPVPQPPPDSFICHAKYFFRGYHYPRGPHPITPASKVKSKNIKKKAIL
jgi:hypothetical protein